MTYEKWERIGETAHCWVSSKGRFQFQDHPKNLPKIIFPSAQRRGSPRVYLPLKEWGGEKRLFRAHRIVALVFCEKEPHQTCVLILNPKKLNKLHPSNLRWVDKSTVYDLKVKGKRVEALEKGLNTERRASLEIARAIRSEMKKIPPPSQAELARKYNLSAKTVFNILKGLRWAEKP